MSALRRDLIDRRMWIVVALLLVTVVAVPMMLINGGAADGAATSSPPPPAVATSSASGATGVRVTHTRVKAAGDTATASVFPAPRDPFATTSGPATSTSATPTPTPPASSSASAGSSASTATPVALVSSSSPAASASPAGFTASAAPSSSHAASTLSPSPPHVVAAAPVSTTADVTPAPAAPRSSWTTHAVAVRFGTDLAAPLRSDLARLTPLPTAKQPVVMFMGVMRGGRQALFALRAGVAHSGPGLCRPDRRHCAAIALAAGQTEHLQINSVPLSRGGTTAAFATGSPSTASSASTASTVTSASTVGSSNTPPAAGTLAAVRPGKPLLLRVASISWHVTHSRTVALAAYQRHSAVGLCELDLANPVTYSQTTGMLSRVAASVCKAHPRAIPFSYLVPVP